MKKIAILGSTGSIGQQTLDVIAAHPDRLKVISIAAKDEWKPLTDQINQFNPNALADETIICNSHQLHRFFRNLFIVNPKRRSHFQNSVFQQLI